MKPTREQCQLILDGIFEATRGAFETIPLNGKLFPAYLQLFAVAGPSASDDDVVPCDLVIVSALMTSEMKFVVPDLIDRILFSGDADAVAFVSESWNVKAPREDRDRIAALIRSGVRVKDLPGAVEVVSISLSYVGGGVTVGHQIERRESGTATLLRGDPIWNAGEGAMVPNAARAMPAGRA